MKKVIIPLGISVCILAIVLVVISSDMVTPTGYAVYERGNPYEVKEFLLTRSGVNFSPSIIRVNQGDTVKLNFMLYRGNLEINIDNYNIQKKLQWRVPDSVQFKANIPGTFAIKCTNYCDTPFRRTMATLIVQ